MAGAKKNQKLSTQQTAELLDLLQGRFEKNAKRHKGTKWGSIQEKLESNPSKLWSLHEMERTGGEPEFIYLDKKSGEFVFFDCSVETPKGRRSICYDRDGLESRKEHRPHHSAVEMAQEMGIELLTEEQYRELQEWGEFDLKTSSWIDTPKDIRDLGGALFGDRRFGHVFIYHNGAQSYYSVRGFRGLLRI